MKKTEQVIWAVFPTAVYFIVQNMAVMLAKALWGPGNDRVLSAVLSQVLCLAVFIWWSLKEKRQGLLTDAGRPPAESRCASLRPAPCVLAFFGGALLSYGFGKMMTVLGFYNLFSNETQESLLKLPFAVQAVGLGLAVPVAEEIAYRQLCFGRFRHFLPFWPAAAAAGALFAAAHGNMIQMTYAFPMSLILAWCLEKGGSMVYPVLLHMGANLITILLSQSFTA